MNAPSDASESPGTGVTVRRYTPADRNAALAFLGGGNAIDDPSSRIHVSDDQAGLALWTHPASGDVASLGPVLTKTPNRKLFYQLVQACALDALSAGFTTASFVVMDARLLARIRRDFDVTAEVYGRDGATQHPTSWRIEVDLADALHQLHARLGG